MTDPTGERFTQLEATAEACGPFLHSRRDWIHRRVQRISFPPTGIARTDVSIDFSLPDGFPVFDDLRNGYGIYFVPLLVLRKWPPLLRLDLRDQHDEPIPLLTTRKNQAVDAKFLVASAPDGVLREAAEPLLAEIPFANAQRAAELRDAITLVVAAHYDGLSDEERERWVETLRLGASLGSNMLFWARVKARPGDRMVVKVSYELPPETSVGSDTGRQAKLFWRAAASMSWAPVRLFYVWHDMSGCTSYHVQVELPEGLEVHRATLQMMSSEEVLRLARARQGRPHAPNNLWWALRNTARVRWWNFRHGPKDQEADDGWPDVGDPYCLVLDQGAYMYVSAVHHKNAGVAKIDLATSRNGLRRAALAFSAATTIFLASMTVVLTGVAQHLDGAVPALLITPALLAVIVVNPGEHRLVRQRLLGVRVVLAIVALLPVAATISLLSFHRSPDIDALRWCWIAITAVSAILTIVLGLSWLLPPVKEPADELRRA